MLKAIRASLWLRQLAVAFGYAIVYAVLRQITFSHWAPMAGLRFSVLLLVPYRYWPGLVLGEAIPLAYTALDCAGLYGWSFGAFFMIPPMLFTMPLFRWIRRQRRLFSEMGTLNTNAFLLCTLASTIIWAAVSMITLLLMHGPGTDKLPPYGVIAGLYFIGFYLGILTVVPLVLLVREELLTHGVRQLGVRLSESRLAMETVCLLLPALALLVWLAKGSVGEEARIAMFLPVAWLALRHGWHGAVIGGTAASIAIIVAMPFHLERGTLHAQVFMSFAITTMLMLGGRIRSLHERAAREGADVQLAFAVAQRNVYLGELQLQQTSFLLEQISETIQTSYVQLLGRLRSVLPGVDERNYCRQAAVTQHQMYRLANSLYPLVWRERGLSAALREGTVPRALDEAGIAYWCEAGDPRLKELSNSIQLALYRLTCEAVVLVCAKRDISRIYLQLRSGSFAGRRWALLRVESRTDYVRLSSVRWDNLQHALGASGLGLGAIKDRAMIFGGKVRLRSLGDGNRISILLFDPEIA